MKKTLVLLFAFLLVFTSAACHSTSVSSAGGSGTVSGSDSSGTGTSVTENARYPVEAKGKYTDGIQVEKLSKSDITIMMNVNYDSVVAENTEDSPSSNYYAMEAWKQIYGTDVKIETVQWDNYTSYLTSAVAAGKSPDIIPGGPDWFPAWPANNLCLDLSKYIDFSESVWNKDVMDQLKWDGKYYVAYSGQALKNYLVFNKTKFLTAGETTPLELWKQGKWNWTQFIKTAKNMTNAKAGDYGFTGWFLYPYFAPYSLTKIGDDGKIQLNIDDSKFVRWMTEVYNFYQVEKGARCDWDIANWRETFPQGKDAMCMMDTVDYMRVLQAAKKAGGDEYGVAPLPVFDPNGETKSISTATIYGSSISAKSANPEAAAAFIRLRAYISRNIQKAIGNYGAVGKYLTDDEKAMVDKTKDDPVVVQYINGIGDNQQIMSREVIFQMYVQSTKSSVKSLLDAAKPQLQAEIDEFYAALGKK